MMQNITNEQLGQVRGGNLNHKRIGVLDTVTTTVTGLLNSARVSRRQISVAGAGCSPPAVSTSSLLPSLF